MKKTVLCAVFLSVLLTACGNNDVTVDDGIKSNDTNGEWIVNESVSVLNIAVYSVDTLQPIITKSSSVSDAMNLIYEPLFRLDADMRPQGVLASGYNVSVDGLTVEVTVKSGVRWHDGNSFSAKDVEYTVNAIMNNDTVYKSYIQDIEKCYVSGNKCVFKLKRAVPNFASLLTFPIVKNGTSMQIERNYTPIGTGPYKYDGFDSVKKLKLAVNRNWHGGDSVGIKNIRLVELKDKEAAVRAFEANEVSCITSKTIDLNKYTPRGKIETVDYISNKMVYLGINFFNQKLWGGGTRQALGYMINKDELAEKCAYERAAAVDVPICPAAWYYDANSRIYFYDSNMVHDLLIADGWNKADWGYNRNIDGVLTPFKLEILVNSENEDKVRLANMIAGYLSENEVVAEVKAVPYTEYQNLIALKQFDLFVGETVMPANMDPTFLVGSQGNYFTYSSSEMDSAIMSIANAHTDEQKQAAYNNFNELFNREIPFIPLFFRKESLIFDDEVSGEVRPTFTDVYGGITQWYMVQK